MFGKRVGVTRAVLLTIGCVLLLPACGSESRIAEPVLDVTTIGPQPATEPGALPGMPADPYVDPALIAARRASNPGWKQVFGWQAEQSSPLSETDAPYLRLMGSSEELSWAYWGFEDYVAGDGDFTCRVRLESAAQDGLYCGYADYAQGSWRYVKAPAGSQEFAFQFDEDADPVSPSGKIYIIMLAYGIDASAHRLELTTDFYNPPVTGVSASDGEFDDRVVVNWDADDLLNGSYQIRGRVAGSGSDFETLGWINEGNMFEHNAAETNVLYEYEVRRFRSPGGYSESSTSDTGHLNWKPVAVLEYSRPDKFSWSVMLDGSGSSDFNGEGFVSYLWDFDGDGAYDQFGSSPTVEHEYHTRGYYHPRLAVINHEGESVTAEISLPINVEWAMLLNANGGTSTLGMTLSSDGVYTLVRLSSPDNSHGVLKSSFDGEFLWARSIPSFVSSIMPAPDGVYLEQSDLYAAGEPEELRIIHLDGTGELTWAHCTQEGDGYSWSDHMCTCSGPDGKVYRALSIEEYGSWRGIGIDVLSPGGVPLKQKGFELDEPFDSTDLFVIYDLTVTPQGQLAICGWLRSGNPQQSYTIVGLLNQNLELVWLKRWQHNGGGGGLIVQHLPENESLVIAGTYPNGSSSSGFVAHFTMTGFPIWHLRQSIAPSRPISMVYLHDNPTGELLLHSENGLYRIELTGNRLGAYDWNFDVAGIGLLNEELYVAGTTSSPIVTELQSGGGFSNQLISVEPMPTLNQREYAPQWRVCSPQVEEVIDHADMQEGGGAIVMRYRP